MERNENAANKKKRSEDQKYFRNWYEQAENTLGFYYSLNIAFKDMDFTYSDIYRDRGWK